MQTIYSFQERAQIPESRCQTHTMLTTKNHAIKKASHIKTQIQDSMQWIEQPILILTNTSSKWPKERKTQPKIPLRPPLITFGTIIVAQTIPKVNIIKARIRACLRPLLHNNSFWGLKFRGSIWQTSKSKRLNIWWIWIWGREEIVVMEEEQQGCSSMRLKRIRSYKLLLFWNKAPNLQKGVHAWQEKQSMLTKIKESSI